MQTTYRHLSVGVLCVGLFGLWGAPALAWHSLTTGGRCKQTNNRCRTTIGNAGGQNACCDPRSPGLATCATSNACQGGSPYKWTTLPVQWSLNLNNMPGQSGYTGKTAASIESALKKAWDAWTVPKCTGFRHKYVGPTTSQASLSDRKLVCFLPNSTQWARMGLPSSVLAVTRPVPGNGGALRDADIVFNPTPGRRAWGIYPQVQRNEMDFADVAAHEIGHAIGFGHTAPRTSLMFFSVRGVGPLFNGLTSDEESGVCTIYPVKKCTTDSQCGTCRSCNNGICGPKKQTPLPSVCKACKNDASCGGGVCSTVGGRPRCLQACDPAGCCAAGYTCKQLSGKQVCVPSTHQCPDVQCSTDTQCGTGEACSGGICKKGCQTDTDCAKGLACRSGVCQTIPPAKMGEPCSDHIVCATGTTCQTTSKGKICTLPCGTGTGGFAKNSPGSACTSSCSSGARCSNVVLGQACVYACSRSSACRAVGGGLCGRVGNAPSFCICRNDKDCSSGYGCNKAVLGRAGIGSCAKRGGGTCPSGYQCDGSFCIPSSGPTCGNGQCDGKEHCGTCPQDCACPQGKSCQSGTCVTPNSCGNGVCDNGENCGTCAKDCPCKAGESCSQGSCKPPSIRCGDGVCNGTERCDSCVKDCPCPQGLSCQAGACKPLVNCGNGTCESDENCDTCAADCACQPGSACSNGQCYATGQEWNSTPDASDGGPTTTIPERSGTDYGSSGPKPGEAGGVCRSDNSCNVGLVCAQQPNGTKFCLLSKNPNPPRPPAGSCSCQAVDATPFSLIGLWMLFWLIRRRPRYID